MRANVENGEMVDHLPRAPQVTADSKATAHTEADQSSAAAGGQMPCPNCGALMPDLKGGKASICPVCGFKDSCCF